MPGTRHLTVGGAVAADVHGKNHPSAGSLGRAARLVHARDAGAGSDRGLARERARAVRGDDGRHGPDGRDNGGDVAHGAAARAFALADIDRAASLEEALTLIADGAAHATRSPGSTCSGGARLRAPSSPARAKADRRAPRRRAGPEGAVPSAARARRAPRAGCCAASVRTFNAVLWHRSPRREARPPDGPAEQLFPLDRVADWNRLYGRHGLLQYQFAVPRGQEWAIVRVLELLRAPPRPDVPRRAQAVRARRRRDALLPDRGVDARDRHPRPGAPGRAGARRRGPARRVGRGPGLPRQGRTHGAGDARRRCTRAAAASGRCASAWTRTACCARTCRGGWG